MSPTSRGLLILRTSHRRPPLRPQFHHPKHASSKQAPKIPDSLRPPPKTSTPTVEARIPEQPPRQPLKRLHWARTLLTRLRRNAAFRQTLRLLPWLPIAAVIYHHFPLAWWPIEGPSMQPTFNPDHTSEKGTLNTKTSVVVLKQQFTNTALSQSTYAFSSNFSSKSKRYDPTIRRGQIVVYRTPGDPERIGVKRVVGVPGDRVTPLAGYPGGDGPVIIPFNHLWLEGDIGDRAKSIDSNYFGPISASMVIGTVLVTLPSFKPWFTGTTWEDGTYPAQSRVEKNVVQQMNPDDEAAARAFRNGAIAQTLETIKAYPLDRQLTPMERQQWEETLAVASREKAKQDLETYELANELEAELKRKLFVRAEKVTLKNVEMSREELAAFQKEGVVPESVLARSNLEGAS